MALDFGGKELFKKSGLEQDTGLLSERWGQEGSTIKNITGSVSSSSTLYTVTAGKRLFITAAVFSQPNAAGYGYLRDGGGAGTIRAGLSTDTSTGLYYSFPTPLYFDTDLYWEEAAGCNGIISLTGWEEDAP